MGLEELANQGAQGAGNDDPAGGSGQGGAGPQGAAPEPTEGRAQGEQTWLVQRTELIDIEPDDPRVVWVDVGTVTVAPRTKRKTIVEKALEQHPSSTPAKAEPGQGVLFRVLDTDSAAEIPVRWEVPPAPEPTLVIG